MRLLFLLDDNRGFVALPDMFFAEHLLLIFLDMLFPEFGSVHGLFWWSLFSSEAKVAHVLTKVPWTIKGDVLQLMPKRAPLTQHILLVPIWVRFVSLPIEY